MLCCVATEAVNTVLFNPLCIPGYKVVSYCVAAETIGLHCVVDFAYLCVVSTLFVPLCLENLGDIYSICGLCSEVGEVVNLTAKVGAVTALIACKACTDPACAPPSAPVIGVAVVVDFAVVVGLIDA